MYMLTTMKQLRNVRNLWKLYTPPLNRVGDAFCSSMKNFIILSKVFPQKFYRIQTRKTLPQRWMQTVTLITALAFHFKRIITLQGSKTTEQAISSP